MDGQLVEEGNHGSTGEGRTIWQALVLPVHRVLLDCHERCAAFLLHANHQAPARRLVNVVVLIVCVTLDLLSVAPWALAHTHARGVWAATSVWEC